MKHKKKRACKIRGNWKCTGYCSYDLECDFKKKESAK